MTMRGWVGCRALITICKRPTELGPLPDNPLNSTRISYVLFFMEMCLKVKKNIFNCFLTVHYFKIKIVVKLFLQFSKKQRHMDHAANFECSWLKNKTFYSTVYIIFISSFDTDTAVSMSEVKNENLSCCLWLLTLNNFKSAPTLKIKKRTLFFSYSAPVIWSILNYILQPAI